MPTVPRSILAATDLEAASDAIVRSAAILGVRSGAEVHLLHSLEMRSTPSDETLRKTGVLERIDNAKQRMRAQVERTFPEGARPASAEVVIYVAHEAVFDRAREVSAVLILVGPHRRGEAHAHILGTTADRLIRTAEVPCLVVPSVLPEGIGTIGVPIDCDHPSRGALEVALSWGTWLGETGEEDGAAPRIRVMHVGWPIELEDDPQMEERSVRPALRAELEQASARVPGAEALEVALEVVWDDVPSDAIVRWAETGIDLLVIATHGRTGLPRALVGSVASSVARKSSRPVLLVPPAWWGTSPSG